MGDSKTVAESAVGGRGRRRRIGRGGTMEITTKPQTEPELHDPTGRHVRVAFVGKGGSGKSTISGTFARLLARRVDDPVVALDSDPLPGLAYALGVEVEDNPIPTEAVVEGPDGGPRWILDPAMTADEFIERHAAVGPDGVRYLQFGNLWGHVVALRQAQFGWSQVVRELDPQRWHLVGDLPGGTRQPMAGWAKYADVVCVVVEPTAKSLLSARRLLNLRRAEWRPPHLLVVANKVNGRGEADRIAERLAVEPSGVIPHDTRVLDGDRQGGAPLDAAPDGSFAEAVTDLVERIVGLYPRVQSSTEVTS